MTVRIVTSKTHPNNRSPQEWYSRYWVRPTVIFFPGTKQYKIIAPSSSSFPKSNSEKHTFVKSRIKDIYNAYSAGMKKLVI